MRSSLARWCLPWLEELVRLPSRQSRRVAMVAFGAVAFASGTCARSVYCDGLSCVAGDLLDVNSGACALGRWDSLESEIHE